MQGIALYPEAGGAEPVRLASEDTPRLTKDLGLLGFTPIQTRNAIKALSEPSPLTTSLLARLPPLQACIEFLILQVPECDLPSRFLPSVNSSNPFITAAHSGATDLKRRWVEEKAVKECGWPEHVVKECTSDSRLVENWPRLIFALNCRLLGEDWEDAEKIEPQEKEAIDQDESDALEVEVGTNGELVIPLPTAPLKLHIIAPDRVLSIGGTHPPMYLTSPSVAAYVRLHIISRLIHTFKADSLRDPGDSIFLSVMRFVEEEWAVIQDNGPPNVAEVLHHLLPRNEAAPSPATAARTQTSSTNRRTRAPRRDDRPDGRVKDEFEQLTRKVEYAKVLAGREKLPAFSSREQFLDMLRNNRCVIVIGETGSSLTF